MMRATAASADAAEPGKAQTLRALIPSTLAFTVCFASWVINGVLIAFLRAEGLVNFSTSEFAWLLSLPILTGAISRVPLGMLTDRFGGRPVLTVLMLFVAIPMYGLSLAQEYYQFALCSLGFGLAGGGFAVGVGFVSASTPARRQGFALGVFGMGNAGAAVTTLIAPSLLVRFSQSGHDGWRLLPQCYAALLVAFAIGFFLVTRNRKPAKTGDVKEQLKLLADPVVWRFGLYYFFVFGGFVSLAQWIVPYGVSVYEMSVIQAGLIASAFSLPSGVVRAAGGWLSDRFGARSVSFWVFGSSVLICLILAVPRMEVRSQGRGLMAQPPAGVVEVVEPDLIRVGGHDYRPNPPAATLPSKSAGDHFLPTVTSWQEPAVAVGDKVVPGQLLARGVTEIFYPANLAVFVVLLILIGVTTGVGKASVYKFIPDHFPNNVGTVGGMVGLIGAMGGFVLPPVFGWLLTYTGLWASCWLIVGALAAICLISMYRVTSKIVSDEMPELAQLIEKRPSRMLGNPVSELGKAEIKTLDGLLAHVSFFQSLTPEALKEIATLGGTRKVSANEFVFREGDQGDALYVVLRGKVSLHKGDVATGTKLAEIGAGSYFGEMALLDGKPRSATAVARDDCEFFLLDRAHFLSRIATTPKMLADILVGLSETLRTAAAMASRQPVGEPSA